MRWSSAFSARSDTLAAAGEAAAALSRDLAGARADLVVCFFDGAHLAGVSELAQTLRHVLAPGCLIGASAHGIISSEHEVESSPALTVIAASLPGVEVRPFVMVNAAWIAALDDPQEFARCTPNMEAAELVMVLADPFTFDIERCLTSFNRHAAGTRVVGGMASAGVRPGSNALLLNDWIAHEGGVGLALKGALRVDVVVSQGCRPVGPALQVTRAEGNIVFELDGQPAVDRAEEVLRALPEQEQELLRNGLYVGRPARRGASGQGDYLIRNLLGADRNRGALAVADVMAEKEQIRLHVRDAGTAAEDLEMLLSPQEFDSRAAAALLFACNGRGRGLFGTADRDISTLQSALGGSVPIGGMFCAGEIGPVGDRNLLHGHTASIAIVRPRERSGEA
jgi:small ligand-binding sensory domain FIST